MATRVGRLRAAKSSIAPNPASIMAPVKGSGTAVIDPKSPPVSPLMPSVKKRVFGFPSFPPPSESQGPKTARCVAGAGLTSIEPSNARSLG
jgi:hypothetical protein